MCLQANNTLRANNRIVCHSGRKFQTIAFLQYYLVPLKAVDHKAAINCNALAG
jgi:hypothetical protein